MRFAAEAEVEGGAVYVDGVGAEDGVPISGEVEKTLAHGDGVDCVGWAAVFEGLTGDVGSGSKDSGV